MTDSDYYDIVRELERERITGVSRTSWWRLDKKGLVPKGRRLTDNTIGWYRGELREYNRSLPATDEAA